MLGFRALLFFAGSFVFSFSAYAVDYTWGRFNTSTPSFPTPLEACEYAVGVEGNPSINSVTVIAYTPPSDEFRTCSYKINSAGPYTDVNIRRYGDSCPSGSTYNAETGVCDSQDACLSSVGVTVLHEHKTYPTIDGPRDEPPGSICENACQYSFTFTAADDCYRFVDGLKDGGFCKYSYLGNGVSCTADNPAPGNTFDQAPKKPPADKTPVKQDTNNCTAWTTNPDGTSSRTCESFASFTDPGSIECVGDYPMGAACKSKVPAPSHSQTSVTEQTTKTNNPDGSTQTNTNTTTDKTNCYGTKPCTSTTKTETHTSGTNPDGSPGDSDTQCEGSGCEDPEPEEEKEAERNATTGDCATPLACEGDAIDCAVLQEEKALRCEIEDFNDYETHKGDIETAITGEEFQTQEETVSVPGFIQGGSRFLPSSCPGDSTASLALGGTVSLSWEPMCNFASGLAPVIVGCALLFGAIYVGRAFGV